MKKLVYIDTETTDLKPGQIGQLSYIISEEDRLYGKNMYFTVDFVSPEAEKVLISYSWPGNIRELKNIIEYLINIVESNVIDVSDLPNNIIASLGTLNDSNTLSEIMNNYEKIVLSGLIKNADTLEKKTQLAKRLGISLATLYRKLSQYNISQN